jgi:amidophosphoribosyltransferase
MDYQETSQIIAYNKTIEEIREIIEADELIYLSLQGLNEVVKRTYNCGICSGCFGGRYPIKPLNKME